MTHRRGRARAAPPPAAAHARPQPAANARESARTRVAPTAAALAALAGLAAALAGAACVDAADFAGEWTGEAVGEGVTAEGIATGERAVLIVEEADLATLRGRLTTADGLFEDAAIAPLEGAEADILAETTFPDAPLRVFLSFAEPTDGAGEALVVVALYARPRVEVRILRGGETPLYGVFELERR